MRIARLYSELDSGRRLVSASVKPIRLDSVCDETVERRTDVGGRELIAPRRLAISLEEDEAWCAADRLLVACERCPGNVAIHLHGLRVELLADGCERVVISRETKCGHHPERHRAPA